MEVVWLPAYIVESGPSPEVSMSPFRIAAVAAVVLSQASPPWAKVGEASAGFSGTGPAGFKIEGTTKALEVADDGATLTVTVDLSKLETGIGLRDNHMRDKYLEVANHPTAVLAVPVAALKVPAKGQSLEADAKGTFSVHGKSKERAFHYTAACNDGGVCTVNGTMDVNLKEHDINIPVYLGITVKPDIVVKATFQLKRKEG